MLMEKKHHMQVPGQISDMISRAQLSSTPST